MTEQGALLQLMIQNELEKIKNKRVSISNHLLDSPESIKLQPDEMAFITFISIEATSDFLLEYTSSAISRTVQRTIATPITIEHNIITKHLGIIRFKISNDDKYKVSFVKLKTIK